MKLPILVNQKGDISTYFSVRDAEQSLEPFDVINNEYIVTDSEGSILRLDVVTEKVPVFWGLFFVKSKVVKIREV
jgi:hypothetical protein